MRFIKEKGKRYMALLIVCVIMTGLFPTGVYAADESHFTLVSNTITNYTGPGGALVIPATIGGVPVEHIGDNAFQSKSLTSVIIPSSVTSIGLYAFSYNLLTSISIPNGVTTINGGAFLDNTLATVVIPSSVTTIDAAAFANNQLTTIIMESAEITVSNNLLTNNNIFRDAYHIGGIGTYTGTQTGIWTKGPSDAEKVALAKTSIETAINSLAVSNETTASDILTAATNATLHDVIVEWDGTNGFDKSNATISTDGSITGTLNITLNSASGTVAISKNIAQLVSPFTFYGAAITGYDVAIGGTEVVIPSEIDGVAVDTIDSLAFSEKGITSLIIPEGVRIILDGAFRGNHLTELTLPNSLEILWTNAFRECAITSVTLGNNLTSIGYNAFLQNQLTSVIIPNSITEIGNASFGDNQIASLTLGNSVETIGDSAFADNNLNTVIIPSSVTSIGQGAFANNVLTLITMESGTTVISDDMLEEGNNLFRTAYQAGGAGTYIGTQTGTWTKVVDVIGEVTLIVDPSAANDNVDRADNATYKTFGGALSKAESGDTIKLISDINLNMINVTIANKSIILDLNGNNLTGPVAGYDYDLITLTGTANLEVTDTSEGASGNLNGGNGIRPIRNSGTGTVTVSNGTISSSNRNSIYNESAGTVAVSNGTVSSVNSVAINNIGSGTVTVSNGTVSSVDSYAINNGGDGSVVVSGGEVTASNSFAMGNDGGGSITISGGSVFGQSGAYISWNSASTINISGGVVSSDSITISGSGTVNVSGGTISTTGTVPVCISSNSMSLNVSGGSLQRVNVNEVNISGDPAITIRLQNLTSKKVSITGALTGDDGNITLYGQGLVNADAGTVVATAGNESHAVVSKFSLIDFEGKILEKEGADIVLAADIPAATDDWNGIIPESDIDFAYSGGSGTAESPYLIANSYDLAMLVSNVNTISDYSVDKHFEMTANIDLNPGIPVIDAITTAHEWMPIGKNTMEFKGVFDGGGFAVKGMYLKNIVGLHYYGLFGKITNATIKNLGVTDSFVNIAGGSVAGIIGIAAYSTVESCYNTAKINGTLSVSGVVGVSTGTTVKNCYNTGDISGTDSYVGGIVGQAVRTIVQDCYNTGNISGHTIVGGIVGYVNPSSQSASAMYRCYNIGNVVAAVSSSYLSLNLGGSGIAGLFNSWTSSHPHRIAQLNSCVSLGLSVSATTIYVPNMTTRVAKGNGVITNSYARSDMKVNDQTVFSFSTTNEHGRDLVVSQNTAQDWSTWFGSAGSLAWDYPADGKLWYQAPLPTLKGVGGIQNPRLPGTGTSLTETYGVTYHGNGATSGSVTAQTTNVGTATTVAANGFTKTGYTFNGWNTAANGNGTAYASGDIVPSLTAGTTVILYAQWLQDTPPPVQTYTVTYNGNGTTSGSVTAQTTNVGTATTVAANGFTKTGHTFNGWNTAANGSGTAYAAGGTLPSQTAGTTITLYAQWTENTYSVSGAVNDNANNPASNASVKLMRGNTQIGTQNVTTASDGTFTITGVPNGTYNLVVSKDDITVTTIVVIYNSNNTLSSEITLPSGKTSSVVEVNGIETPQIVVGNLDGQFSTFATDNDKGVTSLDDDVVRSGGAIEIKLTAEIKDNTATNATTISATSQSSGKTVGIFMDLSVLKTVKDSSGNEITAQSTILTELPYLIDVFIPIPTALQGQSDYVVYRYHGGDVDSITTTANVDGEKIELVENNTTIKLSVKKFSTYAIAYTTPTPPPTDDGSGSSPAPSTITTEQSEGGKITISTDQKTVTITPDDGYVIADVIVDGNSVGAIEKYTFTNSRNHSLTAIFVKESALPYYLQNDGRIHIGFTAIAGKTYKYIAPAGVTVEFRENPKNFSDNTIEWAKPSIDFVTERELFLGTSQDTFSPNESMTRAMFVTVIGRLYERSFSSISGISNFSDVVADSYYGKYVAWANENGIIKGMGENQFAPDEKVTREQMAVIMLNFADFLKKAEDTDSNLAYADSASISSWAINGAKYCQDTKVITGREGGIFAPQESATRAEVAVVIERFVKTIVK